ncbi:FimV/HubP family polar landmark protein [Janthinobacterium sp. 17J80-10]|uniref:FimV/HubP family polar landmark protein n=1 Tax=Janthinobacterium sp. 17J80-10 TaxID=2497863 RepID=UPI0013E8BB0E|nr:FimV/HubP family polar landmark protein [Janthinobacterium sp. 17J80-10]
MKTLSAAVLSAVLCTSAYAAGLGKLTVLSSLGQPLRAEIELTSVAKEEAGSIVAKLASAEAYRQANLEFSPALFTLRFAIENRGERHFIRVTSSQPINEPFVAMLLELGGTNNRLVREYTFLLDPADLRMGPSTQVAATPGTGARAAATGQAPAVRADAVPQPEASQQAIRESRPAVKASRGAVARAPAAATAAGDNAYQVKKGDTLVEIAGHVKPEGVSLDQMLVALYRANANAFVGNNMNRLRAGQILTVPEADAAKSIGKSEARGVIVTQAADFNAYRNQLAGQVASSAQPKTAEASQSAGGKITTQVEEKATAVTESKDKLKLSKAGTTAKTPGSGATSTTGIASGTEDAIAKEKALAEAASRVKELEKNVTDLQKLLEVKNKDLAAQQAQAQANAKAAAAAPAAAVPAPVTPAPGAAAPAAVPAPAVPAAPAADAQPPKAASGTEAAPAEKPAVPAEPVAEKPAAEPAKPAAKPKAKPVAPPPPVEEPSFLDELLGNSVLLAGLGAGLLAGLGGLGFYRMRRKKQAAQYDDSILADSSLKANSLFGSTGGQSVDTSNSVFNSSFAPAVSQLDANEVDPVAEADVYIAYGRDAQAEEILKEALRTQPERHAVRLKLLEIYSSRKDLRAFETIATELYSMTKGEGEDWAEAATMGVALDPNNPLYAGAKAQGHDGGTAAAAALTAATQPQHDDLDALLGSTDQQLSTLGGLDGIGANSAYFDNSVLSDLPPAAEAPAPQIAEEAPSANGLDFDLDGLNLQAPAAPAAPAAEAASDLDFGSMDFGLEQDPHAASLELDPTTAMSVDVGGDDLAFMPADVPSLPDAPAPQTPESADATTLNFDLSDISLDLNPGESNAAKAPPAEAPVLDLDLGSTLDFSTADTKLDLTQSLPSFDLPQDDFENALVLDNEEADSTPDSEMATKLDLAIAYQEIGDREGARELLDEVIKGGNADQSEKAKSLLMSLA